MFCPECRSEYIEGITACADCGTPLVESIADPEPYKFVEMLETFNVSTIAFIKSILDDSGIDHLFLGENFNQIEQMVQPARLAVREDQVDEAREILRDLELKYLAVELPDEGEEEES